MKNESLSLVELNALVRKSIQTCFPDTYWIQAELSDVRINSTGHCYMEFVQKDTQSNALVAKARGIIWANTFSRLKPYFEKETGQEFVSGIKVLVKVTIGFHEVYGYSLTVTDIDPTYTLGDMAKRRKEILDRLWSEGVLTLNKELPLPELLQRIAVISSPTAAGYGDFCNQLLNNSFGFVFHLRLFPAIMQGDKVENSIIAALNRINMEIDSWDAVAIIRGGGATSDLSGFDTYDLAANCAQFPLPVITGIGHERDDTVIDMVSHTRLKTPTAAAEFFINHLRQTAERLEGYVQYIYQEVPLRLSRESERLDNWLIRIPSKVQMRLQQEKFLQERLLKRIEISLSTRIQMEKHRLELYAQQVRAASPDELLKRGYSITLKDGKAVTDASLLRQGDEVETRLAKGKFKSRVCSV